jgi:phage-related protein
MGFFSSLGSSLKKGLNKVGNFVEDTAGKVSSAIKPAVNQVYSDARGVVNFGGSQLSKVTDANTGAVNNLSSSAGSLITNTGEGIKDVSQGIGNFMPYLGIGAAILGGAYKVFVTN